MKAKIFITFCLVALFSLVVFAQTGLPKFKKGESYTSVRKKMLKAGWKPYKSPEADKCMEGDKRCEGRPEMESCAGTGMANCRFLWKRKSKTVAILTIGEDAVYDGVQIQ